MAQLGWRCGQVPPFVVEAADQDGQLRSKVHGVLRTDAVAHGVQRRAQNLVCMPPIDQEIIHEFFEPKIGVLQGRVEDIEAGCHSGNSKVEADVRPEVRGTPSGR
jgi:hypothetical protein